MILSAIFENTKGIYCFAVMWGKYDGVGIPTVCKQDTVRIIHINRPIDLHDLRTVLVLPTLSFPQLDYPSRLIF